MVLVDAVELTGLEAGDDEGRLGVGEGLHVGEGAGKGGDEAALAVGMEAGFRVEQDDGERGVVLVREVLGPVLSVEQGGGLVGQVAGQQLCWLSRKMGNFGGTRTTPCRVIFDHGV